MSHTTIRPTVTKGAAKVPVIMQLEALECGAACLAMVMAYYGKWVPLEQVRADCGVSRDGSNARNMSRAAKSYGFKVQAFSRTPEILRKKGKFPCIIHWNFCHFVVLNGFKGKYACINDPAKGFIKVGPEEFSRSFTGITLNITPGENFEPGGKRKSTVAFARKRLIGAGAAVAFVVLTTIISSLFGVVDPVMTKIFMDRLLTGINREWLYPFIGMMAVLALLQIIVRWAQTIYSLKINGKMSVIGNTTYMWKVLHLPMVFFGQRMAGDIQSRQRTNANIANSLIVTFVPLVLNTIMMIFYFVLMVSQSIVLTAIGISTLVLNIIVSRIISKKRINITRVKQRDSAMLAATTVAGVEMIETIKASGAEAGFFQRWAGYQASVNAQAVRSSQNQYNYIERDFDTAELKLLIDAVMSAKFMTKTKSDQLVAKLTALAGANKARELKRNLTVDGRYKMENEQILMTIDAINDAINQRRKIKFQKIEDNVKKEQVLHHGGETYSFGPYSLVWDGDFYYVVGFSDKYQSTGSHRVDRIYQRPEILDEAAVPAFLFVCTVIVIAYPGRRL